MQDKCFHPLRYTINKYGNCTGCGRQVSAINVIKTMSRRGAAVYTFKQYDGGYE